MSDEQQPTPPDSDENLNQPEDTGHDDTLPVPDEPASEQAADGQEEGDPTPERDGPQDNMADDFRKLGGSIWRFIQNLMNIKDDTDYEGSVVRIKNDIDFQGYNVWVLICSIFIASIGLNQDSTAVIIGAMLISPLMGPIVGAGMAIGTNDLQTLIRSLKSFGIAVGISVLTSFIYFLISPLSDATNELLGRTAPTALDVLIGAFGGMAGIIAVTRKEKTNVIPGVAIATALMPPLCTAGFGLATGNMNYFLGAMYLFLLNSTFIWLATFIAVRYLHFPMKEFPNPEREKRVKRWLWIISILIVVPSAWKFIEVVRVANFERTANHFVENVCKYEGSKVELSSMSFDPDSSVIIVETSLRFVPPDVEQQWRNQLQHPDYGLDNTFLYLEQQAFDLSLLENGDPEGIGTEVFEDVYAQNTSLRMELLEMKKELDRRKKQDFNVSKLSSYLNIHYPEVESFASNYIYTKDSVGVSDTIFTVLAHWREGISEEVIEQKSKQLSEYLKLELQTDTIAVVRR